MKKKMANVYSAVLIDLISTTEGNHLLAQAIDTQRQDLSNDTDLNKYLVRLLITLKQSILDGDTYLEPIYYRTIALAVDAINLHYINNGGEIKGQCQIG